MISEISHITFIVKDLNRSALFFKKIFDAKEIYSSDDKNFSISIEKFFLINNLWICIMQGNPHKERTYNHIAFKITDCEFDDYLSRLKSLGVEILPGRSRIVGEGRSIYFYDFDNNLFELHTGALDERLKQYHNLSDDCKYKEKNL